MRYVNGGYIFDPDEHAIRTGPITGAVTLKDGTVVDVTPLYIGVAPDRADEVAHLVSSRYAVEGHPEHDAGTPFVYNAPEQFADYEPHPDNNLGG